MPENKKQTFNFREAYERLEEIKNRLREMAHGLESDKERESFTEAENGERKQLFREMDILEMKIKANTPTIEVNRESSAEDINKRMREMLHDGKRFELKISRAVDSGFKGNASGYADPVTSTNPAGITM